MPIGPQSFPPERRAFLSKQLRDLISHLGANNKGDPVWTVAEIATLKRMYPRRSYREISKALERRSYWAVRHKAQELNLAPRRRSWTGAEVVLLRKLYGRSTKADLLEAFPKRTESQLQRMAVRIGVAGGRQELSPTGVPLLDEVRQRARSQGLTMSQLDRISGTGCFFQHASWTAGTAASLNKATRAAVALGGELYAEWED